MVLANYFFCLLNWQQVHIYGTHGILTVMKQDCIRTTVDIPAPLYRRLKAQAAANGSSVRDWSLPGCRAYCFKRGGRARNECNSR